MDVSEHIKRATGDVGEDEEKIAEQRLEYEGETLAVLEDELDQRIYQSTIFKLSKYLKHWRE